MRKLAELLERVEAPTAQGGWAVSYEPLGFVWIAPGAVRRTQRAGGEGPVEAMSLTAACRSDPRLSEGRLVRFGGADWRIALVDEAAPGKARLNLERDR